MERHHDHVVPHAHADLRNAPAREVSGRITKAFGIQHVTVQPEAPSQPSLIAADRLRRGAKGT